jgi:hypothetical protein
MDEWLVVWFVGWLVSRYMTYHSLKAKRDIGWRCTQTM